MKGLGVKNANAIIKYRKKHGVALERADDLVKQVGLTKLTVNKLFASLGTDNQ